MWLWFSMPGELTSKFSLVLPFHRNLQQLSRGHPLKTSPYFTQMRCHIVDETLLIVNRNHQVIMHVQVDLYTVWMIDKVVVRRMYEAMFGTEFTNCMCIGFLLLYLKSDLNRKKLPEIRWSSSEIFLTYGITLYTCE